MIEACYEIIDFIENVPYDDFKTNRQLQLSMVQLLSILGEAASSTSEEFKTNHPNLPWKEMIGMRNRIVHGYFDIDLGIVYKTATQEVPELVKMLREVQ